MRAFKAYTSRGTYIVDDVTGLINAIGVIIRKFNNEVEIYFSHINLPCVSSRYNPLFICPQYRQVAL